MHKMIRHEDLDERISDFLARKTAPKNLSQIIADHITQGRQPDRPRRAKPYEFLPIRRKLLS